MKLAYGMRILTGALCGLAALAALWLTLGISWVTATAAALLAPIGFLASYFVVSADRPAEGYEQILFDRPNTLVALILVVTFAGAGIGTGFLGGTASAPTPGDHLHALRASYIATADAWSQDADQDETLTTLGALREESDRIAAELDALPPTDAQTELTAANDAYAYAIDALKTCADQAQRACLDARLNAADAEAALQRYKNAAA